MSNGRFANVIIDISHEKVDRPFGYIIPEGLISTLEVGDCVNVPFGAGNKLRTGFVVEITDTSDYPVEKMKYIDSKATSTVGTDIDYIRLALWMKNTYGSTMISALKTVLPVKKQVKARQNRTILRNMEHDKILSLYAECVRKKQTAKARVLKELSEEAALPYDLVTQKLNVSASTLNSLEKDGVISVVIENEGFSRFNEVSVKDNKDTLSDEQKYIIDEVLNDFNSEDKSKKCGKYLIHGITGAGKTEVYINIIEEVIRKNKQCIVLIPEIALTYQTLLRFYKRFGDRVGIINSTMSAGEKYLTCQKAKEGDIDVIIGPRSALFVPFKNLGLVVMDEEHETSYISDKTPRYHARETAEELCRIKNAMLILGSATPSVDTYYSAQNGGYRLFRLTRRLTGGELPSVDIVDLREELMAGNRSMFSRTLQEKIKERLDKKEQIMLFLNRRGYSGFVSCRACGEVLKCPHCDVALSRHKGGTLMCHYCGYTQKDVDKCPSCGSKYISGFKAGTEKIEEELYKLYPGIRVLRMDKDTTRTKDSYENILTSFKEGLYDVLVGTQMIVKGHDFPNVTLVGVIAADISLNDSDFKSGERTFQLLTQAVGRAGRGQKKGEAVIQTYRPEHYSILRAASQDYEAFYKEEMLFRSLMNYPPAGSMMQVLVMSKVDKRALNLAEALAKRVEDGVQCIGPSPDNISKINDFYRYNIYLKSSDVKLIERSRERMEEYLKTAPVITETVTFDVK